MESINEPRLQLYDAMKVVSSVACGFAKRISYKHLVSTGFSQLIEVHLSTTSNRRFNDKRRLSRNETGRRTEKPGGRSSPELEETAASGNCHKLFQLL